MIADCTIKDNTLVWHNQLHVLLFSSEKLEKHKHLNTRNLKLVVSHLSTVFTYTFYLFCLVIQSQHASIYIKV